MQHLFQSTFLQSLGYAIANSLWQAALVWLVFMSITAVFRSMSAALKYRLAVAAQLIGFVWFIFTFQFYYTQYSHALQNAQQIPEQVQAILSTNTDLSSRMINWMVKGEQLLPYVSMAYLLLMLFLCVRWMLGYRQTQRIRSNGLQKMPAEWRLFVDKIAQQLNIKQKIKIFLSDTVKTPLTIGFLKPVILIPIASINHLTTHQLEAVLLHELAHIKRYDYLVNIILSVVEISLFFNPFTQLLSKNIRKERENSCDDWVLQFQYEASVYAEALLRIAYLQNAPAFAMAATGKKNELLTRVKRMIGEKENRFSYRKQLLAFFIVTGILSSVAWLNPRVQQAGDKTNFSVADIPKKKTASYAVEPMAVSVDNPLFNPMFFLSKPLKEEMQKNIASAQKEIDEAMSQIADLKEPLHSSIESVSPLVAGALEQASLALGKAEFDKEISRDDMDLAKLELGKTLYTDSAFFSPRLKKQINSDIGNSFKEMEAGLKKAKAEIARSFKMTGELNGEKIKIGKDLLNVMNELGKSGVEKLVLNSLQLSTDILDQLSVPEMTIQKKDPKTKPRKPAPDKKTEEDIRSISDEEKIVIDKNDNEEKIEIILPALSSLDDLIQVKLRTYSLTELKNTLLKLALEKKQIKAIPLMNKEKKDEEGKMVIKIQ